MTSILKITLTALCILASNALRTNAQLPETDIFIAEMQKKSGQWQFSQPINMTKKAGYDNQPFFTKDGNAFYFTGIHDDTTQSELYVCDLLKREVKKFTRTKTSEYSPQLTPDGQGISVVRVDADSGQRLYVIPVNEARIANHIDKTDSVGYYCWLQDSTVAMFILGNPNYLVVLHTNTGQKIRIDDSIGRCLKMDKNRTALYYVKKHDEKSSEIRKLNLNDYSTEIICKTVPGSEDFEFLPDGSLVMGSKGKLMIRDTSSNEWLELADFTSTVSDFYRITTDPTGRFIALVAYIGTKP